MRRFAEMQSPLKERAIGLGCARVCRLVICLAFGPFSVAAAPTFWAPTRADEAARVMVAAAPVNLISNSQWEIWSGVGYGARELISGTGVMAPIISSGNSVGSNTVVFKPASTGELKVGDLVSVSGTGVDPNLSRSPLRVIALTADATVTVALPLSLKASTNRPALLQPVNIGMRGSVGTGDAADGWKKPPSMVAWREDNPQNISPGARYAMGLVKAAAVPEPVTYRADVSLFRGRIVSFGAYVYQKVRKGPATWRAYLKSDGTGKQVAFSDPARQFAAYQWRELSYRVPADATFLDVGVMLDGEAGDTYYITDPVFTVARHIGDNNYVKPQETFIPVVHISPVDWINVNITFPSTPDSDGFFAATFDVYAETGGAVAPSVIHATGQIEGIDANPVQVATGRVRCIAFYDRLTAPERSGSFLSQYVAGVKSYNILDLPLDHEGRARYASGVPGDVWANVSLELDSFLLK